MKLYEIGTTYQDFINAVNNGDIPEEAIVDTLEGLDGLLEEKVDNIACLVKNLKAEAVAIKEEEASLYDRRKQKERQMESMRKYISDTLQAVGKEKVETPRNVVSFRKSTRLYLEESVFLEALTQENREQFLEEQAPKIKKSDISAALKAGQEIVGASLETNMNLQIK